MAKTASEPNAIDPSETIIELLQHLVGGVEQVRLRLEDLETRLDESAVKKALKHDSDH